MREEAGIRGVKAIIKEYAFDEPFAKYLKKYFRVHSGMGSRDRRQARNLSFNYFRIGNTLADLSFENRLAVSCFLCEEKETSIVKYILENHSTFNVSDLSLPLTEKILLTKKLYERFDEKEIFSFYESLSPVISGYDYCLSFLIKPRVWIRVREKYLEAVLEEFREMNFCDICGGKGTIPKF